jgi:hypothetical protein
LPIRKKANCDFVRKVQVKVQGKSREKGIKIAREENPSAVPLQANYAI